MFLQDGKPRRKPLVYGKVKRSASAYGVFDLDDALGGGTPSHSSPRQEEPGLGQQQIHGHLVKSVETTPKGKLTNVRQRLTSKPKPMRSDFSAQKEPRSNDGRDQRASAFDLLLSDEEDSPIPFQKSMQKRRRLTPVRDDSSVVQSHQLESSGSYTNDVDSECSQNIRTATTLQARTKKASEPTAARPAAQTRRTTAPKEDSPSSQPSQYNTPKPPGLQSNLRKAVGPTDSPSKLRLTLLSLTNAEDSSPRSPSSSSKSLVQPVQVQKSLSKPRRRLIDAMVSPRKRLSLSAVSESSSEDPVVDGAESVSEMVDMRHEVQQVKATSTNETIGMGELGDMVPNKPSTSLNTSSRPRVTYSRERSHLADMLTEDFFDPVSQSASQDDSLGTSQKSTAFNHFDSIVSNEASEEDLEQEIAGIRSIHELRHSGGNARSQVDLESILEDFEAKGPTARARRLRALTQLIEKLESSEVGRQISEQFVDRRLNRCTHLNGDVVAQTLWSMVLSRLMVSVQLPTSSLKGIFRALVRSGTALLQESRDFTTKVRDRKQNVSKSTCREIIGLLKPFCSSAVWPDRRPTSPSPRLILIRSLDIVLRQARQLGEFGICLPASIFDQLVQLLLRITPIQVIDGKDEDSVLVMESTISVIESLTISQNWAEDGCLEIAKKLSGLGPILDQLTVSSAERSSGSHQLILRLILNITNNDPDLCDAFSEPALVSAIFSIIKRDFLQTPMLANAVLKESTLEDVILALGALSNLAEHSNLFRQTLLNNSLDDRSMVDWIAFAFRDQVEVASEAGPVR